MSTASASEKLGFHKIKSRYIFLWLLLFYLIFASVYGLLSNLFPNLPGFEDPLVDQILYSCSFISLCYLFWRKFQGSGLKPRQLLGNLRPSYPWWSLLRLAVVLLLFSMSAALLSFYSLSLVAPGVFESFMESIAQQDTQGSAIPLIYRIWETVNYTIVAPITEEFIFRGVLLHRLATKWNLTAGIWLSSIIFGLMHPNPIGIAIVGAAWALLYLKTKTLVVPIVAHSMNNTIVVVGEWLSTFNQETSNVAESASDITGYDWLMAFLLLMVSLPFVLNFMYRRFPKKDQPLPYAMNNEQ